MSGSSAYDIQCSHCRQTVRWHSEGDKTYYVDHNLPCCPWKCREVGLCCGSGQPITEVGWLPGWHPHHICGPGCDGQDGSNSKCGRERRAGPPSAVDELGNLVR